MEQENPCLCIQELKLLLMIAYLYAMDEKYEEEKCILQWVESYVEVHFQDEEEKVKIYPHCEYLLAQLYDKLGEQEKSRQYCINGKECLIKNGSLVLMKEYLKLEEAYYEQSGQADHVQICQRQIEAIALVNSIAQLQEETPILLSLLEESIQRECVLSNEVIRELRLAYQWTQEQLSEDICAQETLARIEKGHRSPNKKKYYSMLERMGLERKKYYGFIYADDYQLYEKVRLYNRSISVSNWEKADELLQEIADGTDMDIPANRQFVGDAMIHSWHRVYLLDISVKQEKELKLILADVPCSIETASQITDEINRLMNEYLVVVSAIGTMLVLVTGTFFYCMIQNDLLERKKELFLYQIYGASSRKAVQVIFMEYVWIAISASFSVVFVIMFLGELFFLYMLQRHYPLSVVVVLLTTAIVSSFVFGCCILAEKITYKGRTVEMIRDE